MNPITWFPALMILLLGLLWYRMPQLTRPGIFFSVTVDPGFRETPEGLAIRRTYNTRIGIQTAVALAVAIAAALLSNQALYAVAIGWESLAPLIAMKSAHERTLPFAVVPSRVLEVDLSPHTESLPGGMIAFVIPFALLAACAAILHWNWDQIPQNFPVHWGIDGNPNRWVERTPQNVYGFLALGTLSCLAMLVSAALVVRARRISVSGEPGRSEQSFRRLSVWTLLISAYVVAFSFGALPLLAITPGASAARLLIGLTLLSMAVIVALFVRHGQGGARLSGAQTSSNPPGDRTPDNCWKWGLIYVNPDDPALFVEKRFGLGYTVNFGNRWSWILLPAILVVPLAGMLIR
ncbi:MAG: DUF5808 domain-containing protein [Bryobacteraceae bacterium]